MGTIEPRDLTLRTGDRIVLRSALASDSARVIDAARRIFGQTDMVLTQPDEFTISVEDEARLLTTRAESPTGLYVIAEAHAHRPDDAADGRSIIAIAGLDPTPRRRAAHNVSLGIMVDSAWHRRGVGDALMSVLMQWARDNPAVRRVQLEVVASNTHARRLYERHGFIIEGRRVACFQRQAGIFEDDFIMAADVTTPAADCTLRTR